jgi:fluoride ion exporter CrcB/FEX
VNTKQSTAVLNGIQFGFLGCLSTVSTFAAEIYAMRSSGQIGRAFVYASATFMLSFALGTLVYSVPVWVKHYQ